MSMLADVWTASLRWFMTLNAQEWLYVLLGTVVAGFFCMRGFGSRTHY